MSSSSSPHDPTVVLALAHQCPRTASGGRDAEAPGRVRSLHPCASGKNQTCYVRICFMTPQGAQQQQLFPFRECQGRGEFLLDELPMASCSRQPTALWSGCVFFHRPFPQKNVPRDNSLSGLGLSGSCPFFSGHRFSHALDATLGNGDEGAFLESRNRLSRWLAKRFLPHDQKAGQAPGALSPSSSAGGLMKAVSCSDTTHQKPAGPQVAIWRWGLA